jgi:hypothetical protein
MADLIVPRIRRQRAAVDRHLHSSGRNHPVRRRTPALVVVLAVCGCATPAPAPSDDPTGPPGDGSIVFGKAFSEDAFEITAPSATFPRGYAGIVWFIASFSEPPGAPSVVVTVTRGSGESAARVSSRPTTIADPQIPRLADGRSLAELGALQSGACVMRITRGTTVLAEGRFEVK